MTVLLLMIFSKYSLEITFVLKLKRNICFFLKFAQIVARHLVLSVLVCVFVCLFVCFFHLFTYLYCIDIKHYETAQSKYGAYRGFPTRMVYLYYKSCLRYTIVVENPRYASGRFSVTFLRLLCCVHCPICPQQLDLPKHNKFFSSDLNFSLFGINYLVGRFHKFSQIW